MVYKTTPYGRAGLLALTSQTCYCPGCFKKQSHPPDILHIRLDLRPLDGGTGRVALLTRAGQSRSLRASATPFALPNFALAHALLWRVWGRALRGTSRLRRFLYVRPRYARVAGSFLGL